VIVSLSEAREILGRRAEGLSDVELARIVAALEMLAGWSIQEARRTADALRRRSA
jgi:hypothetical protein